MREEETPDLTGAVAADEQVVNVFRQVAGWAIWRGTQLMPEAAVISGQRPPSGQPVENLALERGSIAPNLSGLVVSRNKLKKLA